MKKFKFYLSFIAVLSLLFTSCSKDDESGIDPDSDKATLSFGAVVQDLANKTTNKQSVGDMPECTDDTAAYVELVLMQGDTEVVGTETEPFRVDLVAGQLFTEEVPELELTPGNYSLEHFAVYNEEGTLIWLAPKGGVLANFVDNPLPLDISLGAGVKKYVDVSVICYDDRDVNQYGYMFFELDLNEAFEYCFFANYCTPEGRHFPASYSVDISIDGNSVYSGVVNTTGTNEDGDLYAEPLCFALPDLEEYADDEEYIDYTVTLLDWEEEGAYGDVEQVEISGSLSRAEIMANFDGDNNVEYEHLRFGCDDEGEEPDADNDGVIDSEDECPNEAGPASNNGCPVEDNDADDDGVVDSNDNCVNVANPDQTDTDGDELGDACDPDDDNDNVNDDVDSCPLQVGPESNNGCPEDETDSDGDGFIDTNDNCVNVANPSQTDTDGDGLGDACDPDDDNDEVNDDVDTCPLEAGPASNNGCPVVVEVCTMDPVATGCDVAWLAGEEGFVQVNNDLPFNIFVGDQNIGSVTVTIDGGNLLVASSLNVGPNYLYSDYEIWVSTSSSQDDVIATACASVDAAGTLEVDLGDINAEYGYYIRMKANVCPAN